MRDKLVTYVDFLFAGAPKTAKTEETKAEILQNTLDKFDDLVAEGKSPEAAYSLAVAGIGDITELLTQESPRPCSDSAPAQRRQEREAVDQKRSLMRTIAIVLYITCILPPIFFDGTRLEDTLGPALMFVMIAIATALMVLQNDMKRKGTAPAASGTARAEEDEAYAARRQLHRAVSGAVWTLGMVAYFIVSFTTGAWHITWLIFPMTAALTGIVRAILTLSEVDKK